MGKEQARALLLKAKIYRVVALFFVVVGLGVCAYFYYEKFEADVFAVFLNPMAIAFLITPFLPAVFFAWRASATEVKVLKIMEGLKD